MSELFAADRMERAQLAAAEAGLDALLITPGPDLRYLTGYNAPSLERLTCLVVPVSGPATLITPVLEMPIAQASPAAELGMSIVAWPESADPFELVATTLVERLGRSPRRVGLANQMWADQVMALREALPGVGQALAGTVMNELRIRKSVEEIAALRGAAAAIDRVHAQMGQWLRAGRTEKQVADDVSAAIVAQGHAVSSFVIVASGPNAASPHHEISSRVIEPGDVVVVDIGGVMPDGYCSDSSRTYAVGSAPKDFLAYYEVLLAAQEAGVASVRPGVSAESVDAQCRELITAADFGDFFIHRTGHGIGLQTHEEPYIVGGNKRPLEPGMVFSVEPGIYFPGQHGARIEDIVVCTDEGVERLNRQPRELVIV
ncbi:MAG: aminopeptidase P family protein [Corynebacteriales bacterium]|nr:aminopeptidase P family protein [Mycobacteriales bacterium]